MFTGNDEVDHLHWINHYTPLQRVSIEKCWKEHYFTIKHALIYLYIGCHVPFLLWVAIMTSVWTLCRISHIIKLDFLYACNNDAITNPCIFLDKLFQSSTLLQSVVPCCFCTKMWLTHWIWFYRKWRIYKSGLRTKCCGDTNSFPHWLLITRYHSIVPEANFLWCFSVSKKSRVCLMSSGFNPWRPSNTCMRNRYRPPLVKIMVDRQFSGQPLFEPMLAYC